MTLALLLVASRCKDATDSSSVEVKFVKLWKRKKGLLDFRLPSPNEDRVF